MTMTRSGVALAAALGVVICGVGGPAAGQGLQPRQEAPRSGAQVTPDQRRALANHHADITSPISRQNASQLGLAWEVRTEGNVTHAPLFDRGRCYFADWAGNVHCVEQETGREVWKRKVGEPNLQRPWHGFVGTGALDQSGGILFLASAEGTAYALDTRSGETIWEQRITDDEHAGNTGRLLHHGGLVFVGLSSFEEVLHGEEPGFEPDFRGKVMALDARTGEPVWDAALVREPSNGVSVWAGFALDPDLGILYFATGNNLTGEPSALSDAVVAVDAYTGDLIWARQATPNDVWTKANPHGPGFAFMAPPQLFNAVIDGRLRRLVGAGQRSGTFWVWDRQTGEPVWSTTVGYGHLGGGIAAAASIGRDRIILCGNNAYAYRNPREHPADVKAVDIASGRPLWVTPAAMPAQLISAGFLTRDLYFAGSLDGKVRAFDAASGEEVWASPPHASIASPIWADGESIVFGAGLPQWMGGREGEGRGVFCYRVGARGRPADQTAAADQAVRVQPAVDRPAHGGDEQVVVQAGDEPEARTIRIVARGLKFEPAEIRVRPGESVKILLVNESQGQHSIRLDLPEGRTAGLNQAVQPGQERSLSLTAPRQAGRYTFICPVADHAEKGMKGTLIVEEGQQPGGGGSAAER